MSDTPIPDWEKVSQGAAAILVAARSNGFSKTFNPTAQCIYDLKKIAKEFGYGLVKK